MALYGNFGFTLLIVAIGVVALFSPFRIFVSIPILTGLVVFSILDVIAYRAPNRLPKLWIDKDFEVPDEALGEP